MTMTLHHSALLACVSASAVRDQGSLQRVCLNGVFPCLSFPISGVESAYAVQYGAETS